MSTCPAYPPSECGATQVFSGGPAPTPAPIRHTSGLATTGVPYLPLLIAAGLVLLLAGGLALYYARTPNLHGRDLAWYRFQYDRWSEMRRINRQYR